jgi:hypothetical protein
MANNTPHGLGRIHVPDERDKNYLLKSLLPTEIKIDHKYWSANGWWGNQGDTPMCVGYGHAHYIEDGPVGHPGTPPIIPPEFIYAEAQKRDGIRMPHDGTTVRAAMDWLKDGGVISNYYWDWTLQGAIDAVLSIGPIVAGTNWYNDMFYPDHEYFVHVGGGVAGGHCYVIDGVSIPSEKFRIKNSWGRDWAHNGFAYISFKDFDRLIQEDGEIAVATENETFIIPQ